MEHRAAIADLRLKKVPKGKKKEKGKLRETGKENNHIRNHNIRQVFITIDSSQGKNM